MKKIMRAIILLISAIRLLPHWILFNTAKNRDIMRYDVKRWCTIMGIISTGGGGQINFLYLMTFCREYRNLFYNRIGVLRYLIEFLCKPVNTLFIKTKDIGPGLFIQHGFATIITARSIGKDCWIKQQVTVGYNGKGKYPVIGDNVIIHAGAKVLGNIVIGNNVNIGANAVVIKNVPDNCTVVGVPAYIVKRNGIKTREDL